MYAEVVSYTKPSQVAPGAHISIIIEVFQAGPCTHGENPHEKPKDSCEEPHVIRYQTTNSSFTFSNSPNQIV